MLKYVRYSTPHQPTLLHMSVSPSFMSNRKLSRSRTRTRYRTHRTRTRSRDHRSRTHRTRTRTSSRTHRSRTRSPRSTSTAFSTSSTSYSAPLAFDRTVYWLQTSYADILRRVANRATQIAQQYEVVWIQVSTYRKCMRGTYRTVAMITYRRPASVSRHRPRVITVVSQRIHNAAEWQQALTLAFGTRRRSVVGVNMDAYYSIQSRVRNKMRNVVAEVGLGELGVGLGSMGSGLGSGLSGLNRVFNRGGGKSVGGMNLMNEPRWFSVFYTDG